jgi:Tfp pilus assembly protein FimT
MSVTGRRGDAGTTLIEALVVVAIISMVTMVAFPHLEQGWLSMSRRQTTAAVAERLREARATALLLDQPVVFSVADDGRLYGWRGATARTGGGIYLRSANGPIAFFGDGTSTGGAIWITAARRSSLVGVDAGNGAVGVLRK